jgi:hypothetical protein
MISGCDDKLEVPEVSEWAVEDATKCIPILTGELQALEQKGYHLPSYEVDFTNISECRRDAAKSQHDIWNSYYMALDAELSGAETILRWGALTDDQKVARGAYFSCAPDVTKSYYQKKIDAASNSREHYLDEWDCEIRENSQTRKEQLAREAVSHTFELGNRVRIDRYEMPNGKVVTCTTTMHDSSAPTLVCKGY